MKEDSLEIDENKLRFSLRELDPNRVFGGDNIPLNLIIRRTGKEVEASIWSADNLLSNYLTSSIDELSRKLLSKREALVQDLIDLLKLDGNLDDSTKSNLRKASREVQKQWWHFRGFADSEENTPEEYIFSEDETKNIIELSKNPELLNVVKDFLDEIIVGEENNKMLLWISLIQSLTKYYVDILLIGDSAIGKTYLIKNCLKIYPEELFLDYGRISKTAPERKKDLDKYKLIYVREKWGSKTADESLRFSSKWDEGTKTLIYNSDSKQNEEFVIPPIAKISTQTSENIDNQDLTRTVVIYPDSGEGQTKAILEFEAQKRMNPTSHAEDSKRDLILKWVKFMKKDLKVIIPYAELLSKTIDTSYISMRRNFTNILDMISAIAIIHQNQREWFDDNTIIANEQDFIMASKYFTEYTSSYLNLSVDNKKLYDLIKSLDNWNTYPNGVPRDIINSEADKKLHRKTTWVWEKLQKLIEGQYIVETVQTINLENVQTRKILYKTTESYMNTILKENITSERIKTEIECWKNKYLPDIENERIRESAKAVTEGCNDEDNTRKNEGDEDPQTNINMQHDRGLL